MIVQIEDLREHGQIKTVFEYKKPMWVKLEFADFTLQVSEIKGIAVIGSTDVNLAIHPRADNQIEIVKRQR